MQRLTRPDGVELAWDARGDGPLVVLVNQFIGVTEMYRVLLDDLANDHRVVIYHPRGAGKSTRQGPYDLETDLDDLEAVVELAGGAAILLGVSDGNIRAVRLAARRPDLARAVVAMAGSTLGQTTTGSEALAGSRQVLSAFATLMGTDLRAGVRTMMTVAAADLDERHVRRRVDQSAAYTQSDAAASRLRVWLRDDSTDAALSLAGRLWILVFGGNPWFPVDQADRTRRALPVAHVVEVEDGPITRPDLTAAIVRRISGVPGR